ncbi:hypothetical protein K8S17_05190 [bacterium]|nr:hypothetical protein [bacterium]
MFSIQVYTNDQSPKRRDGWLARLLRRRGQGKTSNRSREDLTPDRFSDSPTAGMESERP